MTGRSSASLAFCRRKSDWGRGAPGGVATGGFSSGSGEESEFRESIRLQFCSNLGKRGSLGCPKWLKCPKIIRFLGHLGQWGRNGDGNLYEGGC